MILGVGIDIISHTQMHDALFSDGGDAFERYTFSLREQQESNNAVDRVSYYSGRFCVKEAVTKALSGFVESGLMQEIETLSDTNGAPHACLIGNLARSVGPLSIHVSISHENGISCAIAIVETIEGASA